jgi:hypothetical protein
MMKLNVEPLLWEDVRNEVKAVNSPLYEIIEKAKPTTKHRL